MTDLERALQAEAVIAKIKKAAGQLHMEHYSREDKLLLKAEWPTSAATYEFYNRTIGILNEYTGAHEKDSH